jgi:hypothetical protein
LADFSGEKIRVARMESPARMVGAIPSVGMLKIFTVPLASARMTTAPIRPKRRGRMM